MVQFTNVSLNPNLSMTTFRKLQFILSYAFCKYSFKAIRLDSIFLILKLWSISSPPPTGTTKWSRHLVIWSRNHEYSVFSRNDLWSYNQRLSSEFKYVLRKVWGTQNRPTLRLDSHHCVLYFNLIKSTFNTYIYTHIHTHTSMHTTWHLSSQTKHTYLSTPKKGAKHIKETLAFI